MDVFGEDEKLIISAMIYYYYSIYLHMLVRKHSNDFLEFKYCINFFWSCQKVSCVHFARFYYIHIRGRATLKNSCRTFAIRTSIYHSRVENYHGLEFVDSKSNLKESIFLIQDFSFYACNLSFRFHDIVIIIKIINEMSTQVLLIAQCSHNLSQTIINIVSERSQCTAVRH